MLDNDTSPRINIFKPEAPNRIIAKKNHFSALFGMKL